MAYELELIETGQRMALHTQDWEKLLGLARRHGWRPSMDRNRDPGGDKWVIGPSEARDLARALEKPLADLPPERRQELRPAGGASDGFFSVAPRSDPEGDHEGHYFAWHRRWIVDEVVRLCRQGAVEIRSM